MPSKSAAQRRLMAAAAHTKGGFGGVPQKVGKEFNDADAKEAHMAKRRAHGLKHHEIAHEFGTSRQTVGRKLAKTNMARDGLVSRERIKE